MTKPSVTRLVTTKSKFTDLFASHENTVQTEGMVMIQAGTSVIGDPADESRVLELSPDA